MVYPKLMMVGVIITRLCADTMMQSTAIQYNIGVTLCFKTLVLCGGTYYGMVIASCYATLLPRVGGMVLASATNRVGTHG